MKNKKLFAILTLVCFMFTLMPVAAFAASTDLDKNQSVVFLADNEVTVLAGDDKDAKFNVVFKQVNGATPNGLDFAKGEGTRLFIWAEENGVVSPALEMPTVKQVSWGADAVVAKSLIKDVYEMNTVQNMAEITLTFARAGEFTICAGYAAPGENELADVQRFATPAGTITVLGPTLNPENYVMTVTDANGEVVAKDEDSKFDAYISTVVPNNVSSQYTLNFDVKEGGADLIGKTVTVVSDSGNLTVTPASATTDALGRVKINVSAAREGVYSIYVNVEGKTFVIGVACGNTDAAYIETADEPEHLVALYESANALVSFFVTDINGNAVVDLDANTGADGVTDGTALRAKYLHFVEKPAASNLVNADLTLVETAEEGVYALQINKTLNAEGKYTVRAILDNGAVATASWEVKKFETPVKLLIDVPANVELGTTFCAPLSYLDANDVEKDAVDAKLAATGYAIYKAGVCTDCKDDKHDAITVKTDEKYAGAKITLTAASEMYDLVATEVVTVAGEAVAIEFEKDTLEVNVNNKVEWNVVDAEGNAITLTDAKAKDIKYVVLDKPEDAKVSVYDRTGSTFTGEGEMALTSNKVGNVTVQVIAQVEVKSATAQDSVNELGATQTKYYTGTQIFAVGTEGVGDVVVMSIGSNEIVINDAKGTIAAAPIVENNRTFVPFRALAEAFGAEVAWDEATQAVTASLNGVEIVMTIGSAEYTINGEAATMDVAPFINGASTMVPVRFAAEAFGIKVIPTYDENGATADILFNL